MTMKKTLVLLAILIVLAGGVYWFSAVPKPIENSLGKEVKGRAVAVDFGGVALDGPALVTIQTTSGNEVIAIPSFGLPLCAAFENIASFSVIEVGDIVSVRGAVDESGRIVPCENETHYLEVTGKVTNPAFGFEFTYPKGPDGYVILEDDESQDADFVSGTVLFNREEFEMFTESTDAREGPPAMHIRVYQNPNNLSAFVWPDRKPQESNINLAIGEPKEAVVAGANASHYVVDGLYPTDTYVIASGGYVYVLMGSYLDDSSPMKKDFQSIVSSFTFIPTVEAE